LSLLILGACSTSNDDVVDQHHCEMVRDRLVDLRVKGMADVDIGSSRAALQAALGDGFVANCAASLSPSQIACVLDASDYEVAEACSHRIATK
jgi:hypothetical protein